MMALKRAADFCSHGMTCSTQTGKGPGRGPGVYFNFSFQPIPRRLPHSGSRQSSILTRLE